MERKTKNWMIIFIILILLQIRGYYLRNLQVNGDLLKCIVEETMLIEEKRLEGIVHTTKDHFELHSKLDDGKYGGRSKLELDLAFGVAAISSSLRDYYYYLEDGDDVKASESMDKHLQYLSELESLLEELRRRENVEELWELGIFEDN